MRKLRAWVIRVADLFRGGRREAELSAELDSHLQMHVEDNVRAGMTPEEARRQALIKLGGLEQAKDKYRGAAGLPVLEDIAQDARFAVRSLRKTPGFTSVAILTLTLGIGANIAVFSIVNMLLLRPLPFRDAGRLVWFTGNHGQGGLSGVTYNVGSYEEYARHAQSFEEVTCYQAFWGSSEYNMTGHGEPRHAQGVMVAANFFHTLGILPAMGRTFRPEEHQKGAAAVALMTDWFWREEFGGDPRIVGESVRLDNRIVTIVGVLPASFDFATVLSPGLRVHFFVPAVMDEIRNWGNTVAMVGRLKPGISLEQAQREANILSPQFRAAHPEPDWFMEYSADLSYLKDHVTGNVRHSLLVLWAAVSLILLIVCVNLSNLLLARLASRTKEFAMRGALGASRGRLVRQLLTESLVLSAGAGALGIILAFGITSLLARQSSIAIPLLNTIRIDSTALAWTVFITLVVGVLFGIVPGVILSRSNVQSNLKDGGRGVSQGRSHDRVRSVLVVSEVALACVLLVGSGLLLRSFLRVLDVDLGFQPSNVAVVDIVYDAGAQGEKQAAVVQEILSEVQALPGVESTGVADMLPLDRDRSWGLANPSREYQKGDDTGAIVRIVSPGYLRTMGIRFLEGRDISWQDTFEKKRVVVINETAARLHFPGQSPIGRAATGFDRQPGTVIGVVADVRIHSLETSPGPEIYLPLNYGPEGTQLVVRSRLSPAALSSAIMAVLRRITPNQPIAAFRPVQTLVDHSVSPRRFFVLLVSTFAALGLVLAALGIFGVISYSVTRQTQEFGIRMALGATPGLVQRSVLGRTLKLAGIGMGVGAAASVAASRVIASLLFHTEPGDPLTFVGVILLLACVALMAGYFPALRATRIQPSAALRYE
jgi:predicted permease